MAWLSCAAPVGIAAPKASASGAAGALAVAASASEPAGHITWLMPLIDVTPAPGGEGGPKPRRVLTQTTADLLMSNWGGTTQHDVLMANIKRSLRMLESGEPACLLGALHTVEREASAWFADTHVTPPHQFVVRAALLDKVPRNAAGEVRLDQVWAERRLRGALVHGRSYGPELDATFRRQPASALSAYVTPDVGGNLLVMVGKGRADYTIEYDFIVNSHLAGGGTEAELLTLPIEGHADLMLSGVACPKNDWGRQVAMRASEVLALPQSRRILKEELLGLLTPQARARYGSRIEAFYARPQPALGAGSPLLPPAAGAASGSAGRERLSPRSPSPSSPAAR